MANPNTLIMLNSGTYPAKSSKPKINGTVNDMASSAKKLFCLLTFNECDGKILDNNGSNTLFAEVKILSKPMVNTLNHFGYLGFLVST